MTKVLAIAAAILSLTWAGTDVLAVEGSALTVEAFVVRANFCSGDPDAGLAFSRVRFAAHNAGQPLVVGRTPWSVGGYRYARSKKDLLSGVALQEGSIDSYFTAGDGTSDEMGEESVMILGTGQSLDWEEWVSVHVLTNDKRDAIGGRALAPGTYAFDVTLSPFPGRPADAKRLSKLLNTRAWMDPVTTAAGNVTIPVGYKLTYCAPSGSP